MSSLQGIATNLQKYSSEKEISDYWERDSSRILKGLSKVKDEAFLVTQIMHLLARSLNKEEKYSSVYHLFLAGYLPLKDKLIPDESLDELKYELGKGLHHNRKYSEANKLFKELAASGFETTRFDNWWDQSAFAGIRENVWIKTDVLPFFGRMMIMAAYLFFAFYFREFIISTIFLIVLFESYELWWYQFRVKVYLKDFAEDPIVTNGLEKLKRKLVHEFLLSLVFYALYFLNEDLLIPLAFLISIYFQVFHYYLNSMHLPKLIGELNRKSAFNSTEG